MRDMANQVIDGIEARRVQMGEMIQVKPFRYIWANMPKGCQLRRYLVDVCASRMKQFEKEVVEECFPEEMLKEIKAWKGNGESGEIDMRKYHVVVE